MSSAEADWSAFRASWGELMSTPGPWGADETRDFLQAVFEVRGLGVSPDTKAKNGVENKLDMYREAIPDLIQAVREIGLGEGEDLIWKNEIKAATLKRKVAFLSYEPTNDWSKFCLLPIYFDKKGRESFFARLGIPVDSSTADQSYRESCKEVLRKRPPNPTQSYWEYVDMVLQSS